VYTPCANQRTVAGVWLADTLPWQAGGQTGGCWRARRALSVKPSRFSQPWWVSCLRKQGSKRPDSKAFLRILSLELIVSDCHSESTYLTLIMKLQAGGRTGGCCRARRALFVKPSRAPSPRRGSPVRLLPVFFCVPGWNPMVHTPITVRGGHSL